jgi:hypothetical protein
MGRHGFAGNGNLERTMSAKKVEKAGQLPDQVFASWAKDYITKHKSDPTSPRHEDAKRLDAMMPLHSPGRIHDPEYIGSEEHLNYYDNIPPYKGLDCETFEERFNKKPKEQAQPLRTPPEMAHEPTSIQDPSDAQRRQLELSPTSQHKVPASNDLSTRQTKLKPSANRLNNEEATRNTKKPVVKSLWLDLTKPFPVDKFDK